MKEIIYQFGFGSSEERSISSKCI